MQQSCSSLKILILLKEALVGYDQSKTKKRERRAIFKLSQFRLNAKKQDTQYQYYHVEN